MPIGSNLGYVRGPVNLAQTTAGTTQATAAAMLADHVSVPSALEGSGLALIPGNASDWFTVANAAASAGFFVYPPSGASFNGKAADAPLTLPAGMAALFIYTSPTTIMCIFS